MQPDDLTRVRHMLEAAENAQRFISGKSRGDLDTDFDIDRDIVWRTATEEIPSLQSQLLQLLPKDSAT